MLSDILYPFYFRPVTHVNYFAPFEIRLDTILLCSSVIKRKIRRVQNTPNDVLGDRGDDKTGRCIPVYSYYIHFINKMLIELNRVSSSCCYNEFLNEITGQCIGM